MDTPAGDCYIPGVERLTTADRLALRAVSEAGSDHFYGAWKGGGASAGGGPADSPEGRAITGGDRWSDHESLIKEMGDKYPGSDWSDMKKLDIATASLAADQIDTTVSRFGPIPNFKGVKVPSKGPGGVIAEVKRIDPNVQGSAVFLYGNHWQGNGLANLYAGSKNAADFTSNGLGSKEAMARAIITHELGHQYMGLNLHSRLGADRNAAVRKELEPWFHGKFLPNIKTAHVSKYARRNPHEAWAELFSAASGAGQSKSHYVGDLKGILDKHYPVPVAESAVWIGEAKSSVTSNDPATAPHCGWAYAHPEVGVEAATLTEAERLAIFARPLVEKGKGDHFYGSWKGGSAKSGGGPAGVDGIPHTDGVDKHEDLPKAADAKSLAAFEDASRDDRIEALVALPGKGKKGQSVRGVVVERTPTSITVNADYKRVTFSKDLVRHLAVTRKGPATSRLTLKTGKRKGWGDLDKWADFRARLGQDFLGGPKLATVNATESLLALAEAGWR